MCLAIPTTVTATAALDHIPVGCHSHRQSIAMCLGDGSHISGGKWVFPPISTAMADIALDCDLGVTHVMADPLGYDLRWQGPWQLWNWTETPTPPSATASNHILMWPIARVNHCDGQPLGHDPRWPLQWKKWAEMSISPLMRCPMPRIISQ